MSVDLASVRARALYERPGYGDAGLGQFVPQGSWVDRDGAPRAFAETGTYLVKKLIHPDPIARDGATAPSGR